MPHDFTTPARNGHHLPTLTHALDAGVTMTTIEIAHRTKKQHRHVLADVRKMFVALGLHSADFSAQYTDARGRSLPCFVLPKREILILTAGYSIPLRASVIDRLDELERAVAVPAQPAIPTSYAAALRLAADNADEAVRQRALADERLMVIEAQAPAMAVIERITASKETLSISETAKLLKIPPKKLFDLMREVGWIFRRGGNGRWQSKQPQIDKGWLVHDAFPVPTPLGPVESYTVKVTASGAAKLAALLSGVQLDLGIDDTGAG